MPEQIITITQSIKLYDVTGLIEPSNNLYFVPSKKDMNEYTGACSVCDAFMRCLDKVAPPMTDATEISRWSPNDRKLVLKGNVDSFRRGSSSSVYNYVIIRRERKEGIIKRGHFYSGFFITNATQVGGDSVSLELDEDDFTNLFFLHNSNLLSYNYNPFKILKNSFIDRQHYNRIDKIETYRFSSVDEPLSTVVGGGYWWMDTSYFYLTDFKILCGNNFNVEIRVTGMNQSAKDAINSPEYMLTCMGVETDLHDGFHSLKCAIGNGEYVYITEDDVHNKRLIIRVVDSTKVEDYEDNYGTLWYEVEVEVDYKNANLDLFANSLEEYGYRYQQCVSRKPLSIYKDSNGHTVVSEVELPSGFDSYTDTQVKNYLASLTTAQRLALMNICVKYLHVVCKERITIPTVMRIPAEQLADTKYLLAWYGSSVETKDAIPSASQHLILPFLSAPRGFERLEKYFDKLGGIEYYMDNGNNTVRSVSHMDRTNFSSIITRLQEKFGCYIQSLYITSYSGASRMFYDYIDWSHGGEGCPAFISSPFGVQSRVDTEYTPAPEEEEKSAWLSILLALTLTPLATVLYQSYKPISFQHESEHFPKGVDSYVNSLSILNDGAMVFVGKSPKFVSYGKVAVEGMTQNDFWNAFQSAEAIYKGIGRSKEGEIDDVKIVLEGTIGQNGEITVTGFNSEIEDEQIFPFFIYANDEFEEIETNIYEEHDFADTDYYYEPMLEFEPYTKHQLSMMLSAMDINKKRMVENYSDSYDANDNILTTTYTYKIRFNQVVSNIYKLGVVPYYKYVDKYYPYYNEQLLFTATEGLTVRSDSYYEFMYTNEPRQKAKEFGTMMQEDARMANSLLSSFKGIATASSPAQAGSAGIGSLFDIVGAMITRKANMLTLYSELAGERAGAGRVADSYTDIGKTHLYDLKLGEYLIYHSKYQIDRLSYNSICKMLERIGYKVSIYDEVNTYNRIGWNYVKLISFDIVENELKLSEKQAKTIRKIFTQGVTLLHDKELYEEGGRNLESWYRE